MSRHGVIALCFGLAGMALFAGNAQALTDQECSALPSNQFLSAVERGTCRIDIETAAGPDTTFDNGDDGHNGRNGGGGNHDGGGNRGGGGNNGGNGRPGRP